MTKLDPHKDYAVEDFTLLDDGTLDTVVRLPNGLEWRYSMDIATLYRDHTGALADWDSFIDKVVLPDMEADMDIWED